MVGETVQFLEPERMLLRPFEIEAPRVQDALERHPRKASLDDIGIGIECANDLSRGFQLRRRGIVNLVEHDHVGKLDLFNQEIHQRTFVAFSQRFAAITEKIGRRVISQQVYRIDDRYHRVEDRHIGETAAVLAPEVEGGSDGQRFRDAGRFDQQVVEPFAFGERTHLLQQIVAQRAADAAVGHLDELFVSPREVRTAISHQVGVDVDLAHVVHNHGHLQALTVVEDMIQQSCLSSPEEAGQDGDGEFSHADQKACSAHGAPAGKEFACGGTVD